MKSKPIYKYMPFSDNAECNLTNESIWLSSLRKLNDPSDTELEVNISDDKILSECANRIEGFNGRYKKIEEYLQDTVNLLDKIARPLNEKTVQELYKRYSIKSVDAVLPALLDQNRKEKWDIIQRIKRECGIASFCKSKSDPLLWSHYAKGHRGICIEYVIDEESFPEGTFLQEIDYKPEKTIINLDMDYRNFGETVIKCIFEKSKVWGYEDEVRIFSSKEQDSSLHQGVKIIGVIAGLKITDEDYEKVEKICKIKHFTLTRAKYIDKIYSVIAVAPSQEFENKLKLKALEQIRDQ